MKPPSWMVMEYVGKSRDGLLYDVRVRRWHPGFWLFLLRNLRLRIGR